MGNGVVAFSVSWGKLSTKWRVLLVMIETVHNIQISRDYRRALIHKKIPLAHHPTF